MDIGKQLGLQFDVIMCNVHFLSFRFNLFKKFPGQLNWQCTARSGKGGYPVCRAVVKQRIYPHLDSYETYDNSDFEIKPDGKTPENHCHPPDPASVIKAKIYRDCKDAALGNLNERTSAILNAVFLKYFKENVPGSHFATKQYARRVVNRVRMQLRPNPPLPNDVLFQLATSYVSMLGFFRADLTVEMADGIARHLIFMLEDARILLKTRKRWFIDATFKIIKLPFMQLFTISAFVKSEPINGQGKFNFYIFTAKLYVCTKFVSYLF